MSSRVVLKLFDEDKISDEIVGSFFFNLKNVMGENNGMFFWKNIYGSPLDVSGATTDRMNNNPESGSTWKGRVLMQVLAEKTDKPKLCVLDLDEEVKATALPYYQPHEFEIIAEMG